MFHRNLNLSALAFAAALALATPAAAVTITVSNDDPVGQGFNDDTPAAPVGRNPGTTIGAQRLYVYRYAAEKWGLRLKGHVPVMVSARFSDLGGDESSAILGQAAPSTVHRDFPGVPLAGTWYVASLANQLYGSDLNDLAPADCFVALVGGRCPEIDSQFNASIDDDVVLGTKGFYYGVDGNAGDNIDFLSVVLHEIGHGLGVLDLIDPSTGQKYFGFDDAYIVNLESANQTPKQVTHMDDLQREAAVINDTKLLWVGPSLRAAAFTLTAGRRDSDGAMQMYAPTVYQTGSSVSHVDTDVFPNELMEPFITSPAPHDLRLTLAMLEDIGWQTQPAPDCGDVTNDGHLSVTDAMLVLKGAVGLATCPAEICDVALPGGVSSTDALTLLKISVGQHVSVSCPLG